MARITNTTKSQTVAADVKFASTFLQRAFGLMGRKALPLGEALFFRGTTFFPCTSIQTTFMRFPLDVVFLDEEMRVKSIYRNLQPWRMTKPIAGAVNAFEMTAGSLTAANIEIGDQLHVGD